MIEILEDRIKRLDDVGQQSFKGADYTFGFKKWRSVTIIALKKHFPKEQDTTEQISNIHLYRVHHDRTDASAYNLESCKDEAREILQALIDATSRQTETNSNEDFWSLLHPKVNHLAKSRFENGQLADSVLACLREINTIVKKHVKDVTGNEIDGAALMTRAFSATDPIIPLADISNDTGRNIQLGYMKIFEGAMIGIRNPKAHENMYPDKTTTVHLLFLASFIFLKLQESGILIEE